MKFGNSLKLILIFVYWIVIIFLGMWIRTTASIIKRYEDLCINVVNYESRLQSLYITVHNFKEGIDLMYKWATNTHSSFSTLTTISYEIHILIQQVREIKVSFVVVVVVVVLSSIFQKIIAI